jgi:hypothetical protein
VLRKTIVIELKGIKIAAIKGLNIPETAMIIPLRLYNIENPRQIFSVILENFEMAIKSSNLFSFFASKIASDEGVNLNMSSEMAMPISACARALASFNPSPSIITFSPLDCNF